MITTLRGHNGNVCLSGGEGNDTLNGNDGADILTGFHGKDILEEGRKRRRYLWVQLSLGQRSSLIICVINNFDSGDRIDLSKIEAERRYDSE